MNDNDHPFRPAGTFVCKMCKRLSDDGEPWNEICLECGDDIADFERREAEDYYDNANHKELDDLAAN